MPVTEILMILGFLLAAYAVVANDAIQTLGTFLASNSRRPWWLLWMFSSSILVLVLLYGWLSSGGDPAYGRLEKFPEPSGGVTFIHVLAPFTLLILTRFGVPVSTTFLVLSVFAPSNIGSMVTKSLVGYAVAFVVAILVFRFVMVRLNEYFRRTSTGDAPSYWIVLQWLSTAFLWSQWLIQDLANIFVFLPREVDGQTIGLALLALVLLQGLIFYQQGGRIQHIVTSKTMTDDIRAAAVINLIYGTILLIFKEWSNMPMSTTWVFLGLLAGREIAMTLQFRNRTLGGTLQLVGLDVGKAFAGLVVSVAIAYTAVWLGLN